MASMMYNPNNVATEASPFTTALEKDVGMQLCHMLGYRVSGDFPGWGHITCVSESKRRADERDAPDTQNRTDSRRTALWPTSKLSGPVSHPLLSYRPAHSRLIRMFAARNLKFYPLSLKLAMGDKGTLRFLADVEPPFLVENCQGTKKRFVELSNWELLNLKPSTVLDLPTRLATEYSISPAFLQTALNDYVIQTLGIDELEKRLGIKKSPKFLISTTKHYSWPKGGGKCSPPPGMSLENLPHALTPTPHDQPSPASDPTALSTSRSTTTRAWTWPTSGDASTTVSRTRTRTSAPPYSAAWPSSGRPSMAPVIPSPSLSACAASTSKRASPLPSTPMLPGAAISPPCYPLSRPHLGLRCLSFRPWPCSRILYCS